MLTSSQRLPSRSRSVSSSRPDRPTWSMDAAEGQKRRQSTASVERDEDLIPRKSYFTASCALILYGFSFGIAIPAFPAITLAICEGDSALSAHYYGIGMFIRYFTEFLFSPLIGTTADIIGRRPVFLFCFLCISIEYFALAFVPSLFVLFCCRMISGIGDSGMATAAAIFSDIAAHNDDEITAKFGELTAMVALSALTGPLIGGKLADSDPQLCLGVSGIVAAVALVTTFLSLEETLDVGTTKNATPALIYLRKSMYTAARPPALSLTADKTDVGANTAAAEEDLDKRFASIDNVGMLELKNTCGCAAPVCPASCCASRTLAWWVTLLSASNPIPAVLQHTKKAKVRDLLLVMFILNFTGGVTAIFYIYMDYIFHANSFNIGILICALGASGGIVNACTGLVIPRFATEKQAVVIGLIISAVKYTFFAFAPSFNYLYLLVLGSFSGLAEVSLMGMVVKADVEDELEPNTSHQGSLQGAIGSLRCLASAVASLAYAALFGWSIGTSPERPYLTFILSSVLVMIALTVMLAAFSTRRWKVTSAIAGHLDLPQEDSLESVYQRLTTTAD